MEDLVHLLQLTTKVYDGFMDRIKDLNSPRDALGSAGTQTAALGFGGLQTPPVSDTYCNNRILGWFNWTDKLI